MIEKVIIKQLNNFFEITEADYIALNKLIAQANNETIDCLHKVNNKYCLNTPPGYKHNILQWVYNLSV